ncbi:MAG TPA: hypothetical protein VMD79_11320 [Solirubrobacteraceae bacterium]|nr:hypothetical protein [Solirubrobacteraceae bacterium]
MRALTLEDPPSERRVEAPGADQVLDAALEALRVEHAHAEAARSRAAGLLTACGVLLALTVGLGATAAQAAQKLSRIGAPIAVCAAAAAAICLLVAAVLSGLVFAPSSRTRGAVEELRELSQTRFRVGDAGVLGAHARAHLVAAQEANRQSRRRILRAMAFYVAALGCLGAQALVIAAVRLLGV